MCINPIFRVHLKADVTSLKSKSKTFVSLIIWEVFILRSVLLEHPVFSLDCYWINEKHEVDKCKLRCRQNVFSPLFFDCGVALINTWCANIQTWLKVSVWLLKMSSCYGNQEFGSAFHLASQKSVACVRLFKPDKMERFF